MYDVIQKTNKLKIDHFYLFYYYLLLFNIEIIL